MQGIKYSWASGGQGKDDGEWEVLYKIVGCDQCGERIFLLIIL